MPDRLASDIKIIEIKARYENHDFARMVLKEKSASFSGKDFQIDTYFNCSKGRLKLRKGNIENAFIFYNRPNDRGPKKSDVKLIKLDKNNGLEDVLSAAYGMLVKVKKEREIYFIDNAKIHLDVVEGLGNFIEIEVIDDNGIIPSTDLESKCHMLMDDFKVSKESLIDISYSDMLLK